MTTKITIVGLGALGSHVALALRNAGHLHLIDFDRVEQKNTLSQYHSKMGLRRNKAQAMAQALQGQWGIRPQVNVNKVTADNAKVILSGSTLVLDCTDNIAARSTIKQFCEAEGIPLLHGALSADGNFGQIIWTELFTADGETGDGATCEDGENLPFHVLMGSLIAQTAKTFLDSDGQKRLCWQVSPQGIVRV
jgi:predicted ThiF/HesA family dinucleotide-utilizing enzyme